MSKTSSALGGAGVGAAAGTAVMPGIGTAVGAVGGALLGYLGGSDDQKPAPYQADRQNFEYGGHMSAVGKQRAERYDTQGNDLRDQATGVQRRNMYNSGAQGYADTSAHQAAAALGYGDQARGQQVQSLNDQRQAAQALGAFAQQGPGPSAAQAQLQAGANQSFAQQMAAARSGSNAGGQANALRGAAFQQAGIMGQENAQAAELRANENTAFQAQKLNALSAAQQGYGAVAQDAQGLRSSDQSSAQLGAQTALQGGQLQSQTALGMGSLAQQNRSQNDAYSLGLGQLAGQQDQLASNVYGTQLSANMNSEQLAASNYNAAMGLNVSQQNANNAGMMSMGSAGLGAAGSMMSDTRAKKDIAHAEGAADALAALGYPDAATDRSYAVQGGKLDRARRAGIDSDQSDFNTSYGPQLGALPVRRDLGAAPDAMPTARFLDYQPPTARFDDMQPDLRGVPNYSYQYRDPHAPGAAPGRQLGPMAQDLEANPATAHLVHDTPNGKMVDTGRAAMLALPAIGEQQRRLDKLEDAQALGLGADRSPDEITHLNDADEKRFRSWASKNRISDVDSPDSHYDYRGFYQQNPNARVRFGMDHFPDTFKQHGHPSFSVESQYSAGPYDGGSWNDDTYVPQARTPAAHVDMGALDNAYARERAYR